MCEVLSLTGNPCTNPLHRGGGEGAGGGELQGETNKLLDDADSSERFVTYQYVWMCVFWVLYFQMTLLCHIVAATDEAFELSSDWLFCFLLTEVSVLCYQPLGCSCDSTSWYSLNLCRSRFCFSTRSRWQLLDNKFLWCNHSDCMFFSYNIIYSINWFSGQLTYIAPNVAQVWKVGNRMWISILSGLHRVLVEWCN
jgi:hypothetical protein